MNVVEIKNLSKYYGKNQALNDVSLTLEKGHLFALIGPNGAGKTTLVKSLLNLVKPHSGEVLLNGKVSTNKEARQGVAYLPEKFNFFPNYTVEATVGFFGKMQGLSGEDLNQDIDRALSTMKIEELKGRKLKQLSKGQVQRTGLASCLMGNCQFLILDEPFSGLDPVGIKEMKDLLKELKKSGKTILVNSHILSELEKFCDQYAILNKGILLETGEMSKFGPNLSLEDYFYQKVNQS
jgi:ABC-type multidrug transport system ATPase subunit